MAPRTFVSRYKNYEEWLEYIKELEVLSNAELADVMEKQLLKTYPLLSSASAIFFEVINRLEKEGENANSRVD